MKTTVYTRFEATDTAGNSCSSLVCVHVCVLLQVLSEPEEATGETRGPLLLKSQQSHFSVQCLILIFTLCSCDHGDFCFKFGNCLTCHVL